MAEQVAAEGQAIKPRVIGRYALFGEIAAGGMATVHFGRLVGPVGFSRTVAIKRLHPQYAKDPEFVAMFLDEARLASRIQHPNVVTTLDVVNMPSEVFLVMEYVQGESLSRLVRNAKKVGEPLPPGHVTAIIIGLLHGLHAAHEAKSERREPLNIVHRDVSPQNVLVGTDGSARVLDFGVAKAAMRAQSTRDGQMKGKLSYMSPEQLNGKPVDRRTDLFAAGVVLWEALTSRRLFDGADAGEIFAKVLASEIPSPKTLASGIPEALEAVVMRALERDPEKRYQTARQFAIELEGAIPPSTARAVGEWVERLAGADLERRAHIVAEIEGVSTNPEDIARLDENSGLDVLEDVVERHSVSSAMQPASGSRPRIPAGPPPLREAQQEERSAASSSGASTSQMTSLTLGTSPARGRGGLLLGAVGACAAGGALAFLVFARPGHDAAPRPAPSFVQGAPAPAPSPPVAASHSAPPTETVHIQDLPPAPPDEDEVSAQKPAAPHAQQATPRRPSRAKPASSAAAAACNPPFTIDGNGIKRLKPGCI